MEKRSRYQILIIWLIRRSKKQNFLKQTSLRNPLKKLYYLSGANEIFGDFRLLPSSFLKRADIENAFDFDFGISCISGESIILGGGGESTSNSGELLLDRDPCLSESRDRER